MRCLFFRIKVIKTFGAPRMKKWTGISKPSTIRPEGFPMPAPLGAKWLLNRGKRSQMRVKCYKILRLLCKTRAPTFPNVYVYGKVKNNFVSHF